MDKWKVLKEMVASLKSTIVENPKEDNRRVFDAGQKWILDTISIFMQSLDKVEGSQEGESE